MMTTTASSSATIPSRPTQSCVRCADRKVKCDRQKPCSACVKHSVECVFNYSQPPRKRHKRVVDQVLTDRLRQYEALLKERGIDPNKLPNTLASEPPPRLDQPTATISEEPQLTLPSPIESERCLNETQVVHGQGRFKFVDNSLWTRVVEELHDPEDALGDLSDDASDVDISDDNLGFVLSIRPKSNLKTRHPSHEHILQLFEIYTENVDPLTKVVHVPTLRPAVQKAASNISTTPRGFEALMFAVYSAAIMSIKDGECRERFGEPRKLLLSRYVSATKTALSQAKFMGTISLVVLQALVIHIISVRDIYEPRVIWSLTGVAIRIAQGMGLDRDGQSLGLSPFEVEMRRRIWWLIKTHDFRTAEICGLAKFRDIDMGPDSTKWPTNVNDDQLYPGMSSYPVESNPMTDAAFLALRYELMNFAGRRVARFREQGKSPSQWDLNVSGQERAEMDEAFKEVEEAVETKYIRYCDPSQPLHLITMLVGRIAMNLITFLTHHPRRWTSLEHTPQSERQWIWEVANNLLKQHNMLLSNPLLRRYAWHAAYFLQWHAFIHVLDTLRANPLMADAVKAWQLVDSIYENNPDMIIDTKKPIHVAVGNLCVKAYTARENALQDNHTPPPPAPEFVSQLRQQREAVNARKQARDAKHRKSQNPVSQIRNHHDTSRRHDTGTTHSHNSCEIPHPQSNTMSEPFNPTQPNTTPETDPFWFVNGFDDGQVDDFSDVMNMDLDLMLTQDDGTAGSATQNITWDQWDAWLADSALKVPMSAAWNSAMSGN